MNDRRAQMITGRPTSGHCAGGARSGRGHGEAPTVLRIEDRRVEGALVVSVSGALRFPSAVQLTHAVERLIGQGVGAVTVLDLTALDDGLDHTGIAVLVAAARDLKAAGSQVRVVTADRAVLARLPYTLGLRRLFVSRGEALDFQL